MRVGGNSEREIGWSDVGWDPPRTHADLATLTMRRARFRTRRMFQRLRSPRRLIATTLAILFFVVYVLNGIFILSARAPADPERLRLWLSGGMVIYALYHFTRCVWSTRIADLELTAAEQLWLGGGPVQRSSLAVYHLSNIVFASLLKAGLLSVVLVFDVNRPELLFTGMFVALVLLESTRLSVQRWAAGISRRRRNQMRAVVAAMGIAIILQLLARVLAATPPGSPTWAYVLHSFTALGQVASCEVIQWLSIPWIAAAELAVTDHYVLLTPLLGLVSLSLIPASIFVLVRIDAWSTRARHQREQRSFEQRDFSQPKIEQGQSVHDQVNGDQFGAVAQRLLPESAADVVALIARQAVSVRRYWGTIVFSFVVPTLLCLSPLVTGQVTEQWFYVVGGVALCTILLAPPALRIDFRRDLRRMMLLRGLPVRPMSMVLGQLTIPILITLVFQWVTITIAALVTQPGWLQLLLWTGMMNALAVFTFAAENALFLAYPHHEHTEGIGMMIRAKLTFLGKAAVIGSALVALVVWAGLCRAMFPEMWVAPAFVCGALMATSTMAMIAMVGTAWCWKRFDVAFDIPPE